MGILADSILMDIVYFAAIGAGTLMCGGCCYFFFFHCFLIDRTKNIKLPAPVELVIVKVVAWEEEMKKDAPERQLNRGELRKKREREREHARLEEEEAFNAQALAERKGESSRPGTATAAAPLPGPSGVLASLFGCGKKHQPVVPEAPGGKHFRYGDGSAGSDAADNADDGHLQDKKNKKKDKSKGKNSGGRDESKDEESSECAFGADLELGEGCLDADEGLFLDMQGGSGSQASDLPHAPSLEKTASTMLSSAAAEKARQAAANKLKRRQGKAKAAEDAVMAEQLRLVQEEHEAMLAAETAEQKGARRREREEAREREKREREAVAEASRLRHVQDGLAAAFNKRREGAMLLHVFTPSGIEEAPGNMGAKSLFDIDPDLKTRAAIDDRLDVRFLGKQEAVRAGERDVVLENAGPSAAVLPPGWLADPLMPLPLHIDQLIHRRCMVLFNESKAKGWFFGAVSGESRRQGYNYSVKFDKQETANIEIDGIKSVNFSASGEFAYGRGWVLCHRDAGYVPVPGAAFGSRPVTSATTATAAAAAPSRPGTHSSTRPTTQGEGAGAWGSPATRPTSRAV